MFKKILSITLILVALTYSTYGSNCGVAPGTINAMNDEARELCDEIRLFRTSGSDDVRFVRAQVNLLNKAYHGFSNALGVVGCAEFSLYYQSTKDANSIRGANE